MNMGGQEETCENIEDSQVNMRGQEETSEDIEDRQVSVEGHEETGEGTEDSQVNMGGQEETGKGEKKNPQSKRESVQVIQWWRKKCWKGVILKWETRTSF